MWDIIFLPTQEVQMKTAPRRTASLTALHFLKHMLHMLD